MKYNSIHTAPFAKEKSKIDFLSGSIIASTESKSFVSYQPFVLRGWLSNDSWYLPLTDPAKYTHRVVAKGAAAQYTKEGSMEYLETGWLFVFWEDTFSMFSTSSVLLLPANQEFPKGPVLHRLENIMKVNLMAMRVDPNCLS